MTEGWGYFERHRDSEMMRILMNTAWKNLAPLADYRYLASITVNLNSIRASFAKVDRKEMMGTIEQFERQVERIFSTRQAGHYVGRINTASKLEYFYYTNGSESVLGQIKAFIHSYTSYRIHFHIREDGDWEFYRYLLPNSMEEMLIHNAQMIYTLVHRGDRIEVPRQVYHWLLLKNQDNISSLKSSLEEIGYRIEEDKKISPQSMYPFPIVVSKYEDVRLETLNHRVRELYQIVESFDGKYDGWGSVMRLSLFNRMRMWWRKMTDAIYTMFK